MALPNYQPGDAAAYALSKGWQFRELGDELELATCPFCGRAKKLWWNNLSGAFECKSAHCGKRGNYFTLRKDLGDSQESVSIKAPSAHTPPPKPRRTLADYAPYINALQENPAALAYLQQDRGLSMDTIVKWKLGLKRELPHQHKVDGYSQPIDWLMIPYLTKQNDIADVKYRALPPAPKRFKRIGGGDSILFGEHLMPGKKEPLPSTLYLCEGELDALTLDQHGFSPALSTTTGAASFSPRWYDLIVTSGAKKIVLVYDSDVDGRAGAEKLLKKFNDGERDVVDIVLDDAKDSNEYFKTHTAQDFIDLIEAARPAEMEYCLSPAAVLDRLEEEIFLSGNGFSGQVSQFSNLNELIDGGYGNGDFISVTGGPGTGKTTFVIQEFLEMGKHNLNTYLCCLEMPETVLLRKVINHLFHIPLRDITVDHIRQYRAEIERRGVFLGRGPKKLDDLIGMMRKAARRYDLKAIAFDNIHYYCRGKQNVAEAIGELTAALKDLAMELGIPVIGIAQPLKFDKAERIINMNDIKGSGSIEQDSDTAILMWRRPIRTDIKDFGKSLGQKESLSPLTMMIVGKSRFSSGGETMLYFHGDISTFRKLSQAETDRLIAEANGTKHGEDE